MWTEGGREGGERKGERISITEREREEQRRKRLGREGFTMREGRGVGSKVHPHTIRLRTTLVHVTCTRSKLVLLPRNR